MTTPAFAHNCICDGESGPVPQSVQSSRVYSHQLSASICGLTPSILAGISCVLHSVRVSIASTLASVLQTKHESIRSLRGGETLLPLPSNWTSHSSAYSRDREFVEGRGRGHNREEERGEPIVEMRARHLFIEGQSGWKEKGSFFVPTQQWASLVPSLVSLVFPSAFLPFGCQARSRRERSALTEKDKFAVTKVARNHPRLPSFTYLPSFPPPRI